MTGFIEHGESCGDLCVFAEGEDADEEAEDKEDGLCREGSDAFSFCMKGWKRQRRRGRKRRERGKVCRGQQEGYRDT